MKHLDYIYSTLEELKPQINILPFDNSDMRKAYFEYNWDILNNYYMQFCWLLLAKLTNEKKVLFAEGTKKFENHLNRLTETTRDVSLFKSSNNNANRSLIIDSWSNFEFSITYLCIEILNEETKSKLFNEKSIRIKNILRHQVLSEEETTKIDNALSIKKMSHVSINRKYEKLYSLIKEYDGDKNKDKDFLKFFGTFRNCIHSNFIFHGSNFMYNFNGIEFNFEDGKPISHSEKLHVRHHFDLVLHLNKIFKKICFGVKWPATIPCPLDE